MGRRGAGWVEPRAGFAGPAREPVAGGYARGRFRHQLVDRVPVGLEDPDLDDPAFTRTSARSAATCPMVAAPGCASAAAAARALRDPLLSVTVGEDSLLTLDPTAPVQPDPDSPGYLELLAGEGGPFMRLYALGGTCLLAFLLALALFTL